MHAMFSFEPVFMSLGVLAAVKVPTLYIYTSYTCGRWLFIVHGFLSWKKNVVRRTRTINKCQTNVSQHLCVFSTYVWKRQNLYQVPGIDVHTSTTAAAVVSFTGTSQE